MGIRHDVYGQRCTWRCIYALTTGIIKKIEKKMRHNKENRNDLGLRSAQALFVS